MEGHGFSRAKTAAREDGFSRWGTAFPSSALYAKE